MCTYIYVYTEKTKKYSHVLLIVTCTQNRTNICRAYMYVRKIPFELGVFGANIINFRFLHKIQCPLGILESCIATCYSLIRNLYVLISQAI